MARPATLIVVALLLAAASPGPADACPPVDERRPTRESVEKRVGASFVSIPAGSFEMGCSDGDGECEPNEKPRHRVRITKTLEMMKTEVPWAWFRDWAELEGLRPPQQPAGSADDVPVVSVTWNDAQAFCFAFGARLPTEAEWEYAARAGSAATMPNALNEEAWHLENSEGHSHAVATKKANGFGLYDMLGNVSEWCADPYDGHFYERKVETDPIASSPQVFMVIRGGGWNHRSSDIRFSARGSNYRSGSTPFIGFRCLRDGSSPAPLVRPVLPRIVSTPAAVSGLEKKWYYRELGRAVRDQNRAAVLKLISRGDIEPLNSLDDDHRTILEECFPVPVSPGEQRPETPAEFIRFLVNEGLDLNRRIGSQGQTILMYKLQYVAPSAAEILALLEAGADPRIPDLSGDFPIHAAVIADYGIEETRRATHVIESLLEHGADPRTRDAGGWLPLHRAVYSSRRAETVRWLLERGVDPNETTSHSGMTALDVLDVRRLQYGENAKLLASIEEMLVAAGGRRKTTHPAVLRRERESRRTPVPTR